MGKVISMNAYQRYAEATNDLCEEMDEMLDDIEAAADINRGPGDAP